MDTRHKLGQSLEVSLTLTEIADLSGGASLNNTRSRLEEDLVVIVAKQCHPLIEVSEAHFVEHAVAVYIPPPFLEGHWAESAAADGAPLAIVDNRRIFPEKGRGYLFGRTGEIVVRAIKGDDEKRTGQ